MLHTISTMRGDVKFDDERYYVVIIGTTKITRIVTCTPVHEGGMVEFTDALTGEPAGCCGIHWFRENVVDLDDFYYQGRPSTKPPWPSTTN